MLSFIERKYRDILKTEYIVETIRKFERIRSIMFIRGDIEQMVNSYLHYDKLILDFNKDIESIKKDIDKCNQQKYSLINHSILQLKSEGKLMDWLNKINEKELIELKSLCDIEVEFKEIDRYNFFREKEIRNGKVKHYL